MLGNGKKDGAYYCSATSKKSMVSPEQKHWNIVSDLCGTRKLQGYIQELSKSLFIWLKNGVSQLHPWRGQTKDNKSKYKPSALLFGFTYYLFLGKKKYESYVWEETEMVFKIKFLVLCKNVPMYDLKICSSPSAPALFALGIAWVYSLAFNSIERVFINLLKVDFKFFSSFAFACCQQWNNSAEIFSIRKICEITEYALPIRDGYF